MTPVMRVTALSIALANLVACGGGGGGGGGGVVVPSEVTFSSFGAIAPNQTVAMNAVAITANVSGTTDTGGNVTLNSVNFTPEGAGTVRLSYDGSRALSGVNISTPQPNSSVSFDRNTPNHSISCSSATCVAASPTASAAVIDPFHPATNWNYQSFGVWAVDTSLSTAVFGALSAGNPTPSGAVPTIGSAVFSGLTAGFYVNPAGNPFATASTMTANVDFFNRSIGFTTSDMTLVDVNNPSVSSTRSDLRISGTSNYASGANSFSITVNTAHAVPGDRLSGTASGRFYGPAAQEIGGIYTLSGGGVERMIGGFGGKR